MEYSSRFFGLLNNTIFFLHYNTRKIKKPRKCEAQKLNCYGYQYHVLCLRWWWNLQSETRLFASYAMSFIFNSSPPVDIGTTWWTSSAHFRHCPYVPSSFMMFSFRQSSHNGCVYICQSRSFFHSCVLYILEIEALAPVFCLFFFGLLITGIPCTVYLFEYFSI